MVDTQKLSREDKELIQEGEKTLQRFFKPGWNQVAAAVRTKSGRIFTAFNLDTYVGAVGICAEPIAIGQALMATNGEEERDITAVVALRGSGEATPPDKIVLVSPCGKCRELIADYAPHAYVIVPGKGGAHRRTISELLPNKYHRGEE